jgi:hypothetical protein
VFFSELTVLPVWNLEEDGYLTNVFADVILFEKCPVTSPGYIVVSLTELPVCKEEVMEVLGWPFLVVVVPFSPPRNVLVV